MNKARICDLIRYFILFRARGVNAVGEAANLLLVRCFDRLVLKGLVKLLVD